MPGDRPYHSGVATSGAPGDGGDPARRNQRAEPLRVLTRTGSPRSAARGDPPEPPWPRPARRPRPPGGPLCLRRRPAAGRPPDRRSAATRRGVTPAAGPAAPPSQEQRPCRLVLWASAGADRPLRVGRSCCRSCRAGSAGAAAADHGLGDRQALADLARRADLPGDRPLSAAGLRRSDSGQPLALQRATGSASPARPPAAAATEPDGVAGAEPAGLPGGAPGHLQGRDRQPSRSPSASRSARPGPGQRRPARRCPAAAAAAGVRAVPFRRTARRPFGDAASASCPACQRRGPTWSCPPSATRTAGPWLQRVGTIPIPRTRCSASRTGSRDVVGTRLGARRRQPQLPGQAGMLSARAGRRGGPAASVLLAAAGRGAGGGGRPAVPAQADTVRDAADVGAGRDQRARRLAGDRRVRASTVAVIDSGVEPGRIRPGRLGHHRPGPHRGEHPADATPTGVCTGPGWRP